MGHERLHAIDHNEGGADAIDPKKQNTCFKGWAEAFATAPPITPVDGGVYLILNNPTGIFVGHRGDEATYTTAGGWTYRTPTEGWMYWVKDGSVYYRADPAQIAPIQPWTSVLQPVMHGIASVYHTADTMANFGTKMNDLGNSKVLTTSGAGILQSETKASAFNTAFGTGAGTSCQGDDARLSDARVPLSHIHGNISNGGLVGVTASLPLITGTGGIVQAGAFGTGATDFCVGNDSRLSDWRVPLSHVHGNISNGGLIGITASLPIITGTGGILQAGAFGSSAGQFCQGNDSRLSDARTPTAHTLGGSAHTADTIANLNSKISDLIATYGGIRDIGVGTLVQRPAFGTANRFFWTTDEQKLYRDTGAAWETMAGGTITHASTTGQTTDDHHAKSHSHSIASGSGAIATDQISKFGDGGTTNYAEIQTSGKFRGYGTGRFKRVMYAFSNQMTVGGTYTFNGNSYQVSTLVVIATTDRPGMFRSFSTGARQYCLAQVALPLDYVAGTDFEVNLACSANGSGNAMVNVGLLGTSDGDSYDVAPTYQTLSAVTLTGTYQRVTKTFTITGTNYNPDDCISMVIMRNGLDGGDTLSVALQIAGMGIKYISDKLGADV